jgi:3-methyladenine DNA glycosylase Tag
MHDLTPHDSGAPRQITPTTPSDWFEVLTRAVFNAGMSWQVVQSHWPATAAAFAGFDPQVVAGYDEQDVERLLTDDRLIRSRAKLAAVTANARTFMELADAHGDFPTWLRGLGDYDARERGLVRAFAYIGEFGAYWVQYTCGLDVPDHRAWARARGRSLPAHLRGDAP